MHRQAHETLSLLSLQNTLYFFNSLSCKQNRKYTPSALLLDTITMLK